MYRKPDTLSTVSFATPSVDKGPMPGNSLKPSLKMSRTLSEYFVPRCPRRSVFSCAVVGIFVRVVFFVLAESSQAWQPREALEIYFVDVEGGQATLFVTPKGQSLLIDTRWPGHAGRD